jgi:hypothetical protein
MELYGTPFPLSTLLSSEVFLKKEASAWLTDGWFSIVLRT